MKDYSAMSDFEINKHIAAFSPELYYIAEDGDPVYLSPSCAPAYTGTDYDEVVFDPCNNPADAWPIIVENKISISHEIARYCASSLSYDKRHFENETDGFKIFRFTGEMGDVSSRAALRAAMIVYLMMRDCEK